MDETERRHHVVIVGGGFGGLYAAKTLSRAPVRVTLIDRRNFHLFQPLLYQVATGGLSPANIASPLRGIFKRRRNIRVCMGEVTGFDPRNRRVMLSDGAIGYDSLIVAAGAANFYFGKEEWRRHAPGLKTIEDATEIRRRILLAFEAAERETDPGKARELLTFVVVGGGPTGVELAGTLAEICRDTLRHEFWSIDPSRSRIILLEAAPRILPAFAPGLAEKAVGSLERLGVTVMTGASVADIQADLVTLRKGGSEEIVPTRTVIWAAGVRPSPLGQKLAEATGAATDEKGGIIVEPDLSIRGHPGIFVIGDMAHCADRTGESLPALAPVAMQEGRYVAKLISDRLRDADRMSPGRPFRYRDYGIMATIGRAAAVANVFGLRFAGYPAWLAWLFIHLMYLVEFENRLLVLLQWAWNYFTFNRSARLITQAWGSPHLLEQRGNSSTTRTANKDERQAAGAPDDVRGDDSGKNLPNHRDP